MGHGDAPRPPKPSNVQGACGGLHGLQRALQPDRHHDAGGRVLGMRT